MIGEVVTEDEVPVDDEDGDVVEEVGMEGVAFGMVVSWR